LSFLEEICAFHNVRFLLFLLRLKLTGKRKRKRKRGLILWEEMGWQTFEMKFIIL